MKQKNPKSHEPRHPPLTLAIYRPVNVRTPSSSRQFHKFWKFAGATTNWAHKTMEALFHFDWLTAILGKLSDIRFHV